MGNNLVNFTTIRTTMFVFVTIIFILVVCGWIFVIAFLIKNKKRVKTMLEGRILNTRPPVRIYHYAARRSWYNDKNPRPQK